MTDKTERIRNADQALARVSADFGGRRKILDRRIKQVAIAHNDRRSNSDRRSGFDRRSAVSQYDKDLPEKRAAFRPYTET